jgi:hypothetical protein
MELVFDLTLTSAARRHAPRSSIGGQSLCAIARQHVEARAGSGA